jgi:hypothetical protein
MTRNKDGVPDVDPRRISKQQWISDSENKVIENFSKYIGVLTNQNVLYSEPWQVNLNEFNTGNEN